MTQNAQFLLYVLLSVAILPITKVDHAAILPILPILPMLIVISGAAGSLAVFVNIAAQFDDSDLLGPTLKVDETIFTITIFAIVPLILWIMGGFIIRLCAKRRWSTRWFAVLLALWLGAGCLNFVVVSMLSMASM